MDTEQATRYLKNKIEIVWSLFYTDNTEWVVTACKDIGERTRRVAAVSIWWEELGLRLSLKSSYMQRY